jgi:hypothetical protein
VSSNIRIAAVEGTQTIQFFNYPAGQQVAQQGTQQEGAEQPGTQQAAQQPRMQGQGAQQSS